MPELVIETPEGVRLRHEIAGAGSRSAAALVDLLLFYGILVVLVLLVGLVGSVDPSGFGGFVFGLLVGGMLLFMILYQVAFGLLWAGQTPGKRLLGIRVMDAQGYPAGPAAHMLRGLFWPLELFLMVPAPLGMILIAATEKRQRLGDLVAGTIVLHEPQSGGAAEPFSRETWSGSDKRKLHLSPAMAARFDGEDLSYLRSLFGRVGLEAAARERLFVDSARHYLGALGFEQKSDLNAEEAWDILRELFLYLRELRSEGTLSA